MEQFPPEEDDRDEFTANFFETVGWLNEGVFCGYFDPRESDVVWANLDFLKKYCGTPSHPLVAPFLASEITKLYKSNDPFRASRQMPDGAQKAFELPLFPHALAAADRWARDGFASMCTSFLIASKRYKGLNVYDPYSQPRESDVTFALKGDVRVDSETANLLAGFIKVLEHMESSRAFFEYARNRSDVRSDFSSYCQRIGTLNAWRVPLFRDNATRKLEDLFYLLESSLRSSLRDRLMEDWSSIEIPFRNRYSSLIESWSNDHLIAFFELV